MSLALKFIESRTWAILDEYLELMTSVIERDLDSQKGIAEAIERRFGEPIAGTREATVRDGVAIIPVTGPMFRYANLLTQISGATSFERLAHDIGTAVDDEMVKQIILDINSPGGEVDGAAETAELIASLRGEKPITAFVSHLGTSAAYWMASAADEVIVAETSLIGSIGAVIGVVNYDRLDEKRGIRRMEFVSSQSPDKRVDPFSEDEDEQARAKAVLQGLVDKLGAVFIEKVASYRGMTPESVMATKGGILIGADAVEAGLADGLGTLEGLIAAFSGAGDDAGSNSLSFAAGELISQTGEGPMTENVSSGTVALPEPEAPEIDRAFLDANHADLVAEIAAEAKAEERDRVMSIYTLEAHGFEELKAQMMENPEGSRGECAALILEAKGEKERRRREAMTEELEADEAEIAEVTASSLPGEENEEEAVAAMVLGHAQAAQ